MIFKLYLIALPVFVALDAVWLGLIAKNFYAKQIGWLLKSTPNFYAAAVFYLLFVLGLVVFVIQPSIFKGSLWSAVGLGLLFGLITYATYDLTNFATIKNWPISVTVIDLIWGSLLGAIVSTATYLIYTRI